MSLTDSRAEIFVFKKQVQFHGKTEDAVEVLLARSAHNSSVRVANQNAIHLITLLKTITACVKFIKQSSG